MSNQRLQTKFLTNERAHMELAPADFRGAF